MFFEKDKGMCHTTDDGAFLCCTCFLCYCYGLTCPCNIAFPLKGGGGPVATEWADGLDGELAANSLAVAQKMERTVPSVTVKLVNW